jgi:hypothetical protein
MSELQKFVSARCEPTRPRLRRSYSDAICDENGSLVVELDLPAQIRVELCAREQKKEHDQP